jgi:hypothetical protein
MSFRNPRQRTRRTRYISAAIGLATLAGLPARPAVSSGGAAAEWPSYAGDKASTKYSPLAQIDKDNFKCLKVAWTWRSADEEVVRAPTARPPCPRPARAVTSC